MPSASNLKALYSNEFHAALYHDTPYVGANIKLTNLNGAFCAPKRAS